MVRSAREQVTLVRARAVQKKVHARFSKVARVNGVGITRVGDGYGVKVNLATKPKPGAELPAAIDGVPIQTEVVGVIRSRRAS